MANQLKYEGNTTGRRKKIERVPKTEMRASHYFLTAKKCEEKEPDISGFKEWILAFPPPAVVMTKDVRMTSSPSNFFCDPAIIELICYCTTVNRLLYDNIARKNWTGAAAAAAAIFLNQKKDKKSYFLPPNPSSNFILGHPVVLLSFISCFIVVR